MMQLPSQLLMKRQFVGRWRPAASNSSTEMGVGLECAFDIANEVFTAKIWRGQRRGEFPILHKAGLRSHFTIL